MKAERYCPDANSLVEAWSNRYRKDVFPSLWLRMAKNKDKFAIIDPVIKEIARVGKKDNDPGLYNWLIKNNFEFPEVGDEITSRAQELIEKYCITERRTKEVSVIDATMIAYAEKMGYNVVVLEKRRRRELDRPNHRRMICEELGVKVEEIPDMLAEIGINI